MAANYSGKQFELVIARHDQSVVAVGAATTAGSMASGTNMFYRVDSVGDFDYAAGFSTAEVNRGSSRAMMLYNNMAQAHGHMDLIGFARMK